jgi:hypothetical protein
VEVADFRSGQIAEVMPGQSATSFQRGKAGLSLSGSGTFNPIEQGKPRPSSVDRIPVPKGGLSAPRNAANGQTIHALAAIDRVGGRIATAHGGLRISSALGDVKLDFHKVTHGLARGASATNAVSRNAANHTIWSSAPTTSASAVSSTTTGNSSASSSASPVDAAVAAATNAGSTNGSGGNGIGNGAGGNGNRANGNGNGGVGNGKGNGNVKH